MCRVRSLLTANWDCPLHTGWSLKMTNSLEVWDEGFQLMASSVESDVYKSGGEIDFSKFASVSGWSQQLRWLETGVDGCPSNKIGQNGRYLNIQLLWVSTAFVNAFAVTKENPQKYSQTWNHLVSIVFLIREKSWFTVVRGWPLDVTMLGKIMTQGFCGWNQIRECIFVCSLWVPV